MPRLVFEQQRDSKFQKEEEEIHDEIYRHRHSEDSASMAFGSAADDSQPSSKSQSR